MAYSLKRIFDPRVYIFLEAQAFRPLKKHVNIRRRWNSEEGYTCEEGYDYIFEVCLMQQEPRNGQRWR